MGYKLTDHADIKVTDTHYVDFNLNIVRKDWMILHWKVFWKASDLRKG